MKKIISLILIIVAVFTLFSCYKGVTYLKLPADNDADMFDTITEVDASGDDAVVFHTYETIKDVSVNLMKYDYDTDEYSVDKVLLEKSFMEMSETLKIKLDFASEVPYVMIKYTRQNGETREQYVYRSPKDERLWLLERE